MPTDSTESVFVGVDTHADTHHVAVVEIWAAIWMTGSSRPIRADTVSLLDWVAPLDRWPRWRGRHWGLRRPACAGAHRSECGGHRGQPARP